MNWQKWNPSYFYYNDGWYKPCPPGLYGNTDSWTWEPWDSAWKQCTGESRSQWQEWDESQLFKLAGSTCNEATCMPAYYLNTTDLEWYNCDTGCLEWEFPNNNVWLKWDYIYKMITPGTCTHWDSVPGFQINDFGVWVEDWGDGINYGEYECDDGNLDDGDGCSSSWKIEQGYSCSGTTWWEIVKPTAIVSKVNK